MTLPFEIEGQVKNITLIEVGARLWPFGKWTVVYEHVTQGIKFSVKTTKEMARQGFFQFETSKAMPSIGIQKIGGCFHGIRYKPRKGRERIKTTL